MAGRYLMRGVIVSVPTRGGNAFSRGRRASDKRGMDVRVVVFEDAPGCGPSPETRVWIDRQELDGAVEVVGVRLAVASKEELADALGAPGARYVALVRAGDTWTAPDKLARQIAWLEENRRSPACFHAVERVTAAGPALVRPPRPADRFDLSDLWLEPAFIAASSLVFRRTSLTDLPSWAHRPIVSVDWSLPVLLAHEGPLGYLDELLAVVRSRAGHPALPAHEHEIAERQFVNARLDFRFQRLLERHLGWRTRRRRLRRAAR